MIKYTLKAEVRKNLGSNSAKKLRAQEIVTAELYQRDEENLSLQVSARDLLKIMDTAGTTAIIDLEIEGKVRKVLIKDYQRHPYKNMFLHVDFLGINMDEKLKVAIPIVLLNRDDIYLQPSILLQSLEEVEVEVLPSDIPAQAEIDVKEMQYDQTFFVKDLDIYGKDGIEVLVDPDEPVCSLSEPREEVELDEEVEIDPSAVEVIGEEETEEE